MRLKFFGELDLLQAPAVNKDGGKEPAQITPADALQALGRGSGSSAALVLPVAAEEGGDGARPDSQRSGVTELMNETADLMNTLPPELARQVRARFLVDSRKA